jgi:dCMP deaminase
MSDDPDTQTACIVVAEGTVLCAANETPCGIQTTVGRQTKPAKYLFIGHAEETLTSLAARAGTKLARGIMYLNWFPCAACARQIINAGIAVLYANQAAFDARSSDPRYSFAESMEMLVEAGVRIEWF